MENLNATFNPPELKQAINSLQNGKQPGLDNIHPEFIKKLGSNTVKVLLHIYTIKYGTIMTPYQ